MQMSIQSGYKHVCDTNWEIDRSLRKVVGVGIVKFRILKNAFVSVIVFGLVLQAGADPNLALLVIALINGVDLAELAAMYLNGENEQ